MPTDLKPERPPAKWWEAAVLTLGIVLWLLGLARQTDDPVLTLKYVLISMLMVAIYFLRPISKSRNTK